MVNIRLHCCLLLSWALFCVMAWKPDLMLATDRLDPQVSHWMKNSLVSFWRMVSGERHVWHVTYSSVGEKQERKQVTVWLEWFFRKQVFSLFCSQLSGGLVIQDLKTKTNCEENWGERAFSPVPPFLRVIFYNTCSIHHSNMIPMGIFLYLVWF